MRVEQYVTEKKVEWNGFVKKAKNSHFFFLRDYMDYHSDRFQDFSLMIYNGKNKLVALLPANKKDGVLYSHQGLTFGGLLIDSGMRTEMVLNIFDSLKVFLKEKGIQKVIYKCIPYIYHTIPAEEDRYALFRNDAKLIRRDVTTTINLQNKITYQEQRKRSIKKAIKNDLEFEESKDIYEYMNILNDVLALQHNAKTVHSYEEMKKLFILFPQNIRLFIAKKSNQMLAGTLVFENGNIVHTQYLANSIQGKSLGALDFVIDKLITDVYKDKKYFDFGISNEDDGNYLNEGLIAQKEGFGARAVAHDFYEWSI